MPFLVKFSEPKWQKRLDAQQATGRSGNLNQAYSWAGSGWTTISHMQLWSSEANLKELLLRCDANSSMINLPDQKHDSCVQYDLAVHGLKMRRSYEFDPGSYPGAMNIDLPTWHGNAADCHNGVSNRWLRCNNMWHVITSSFGASDFEWRLLFWMIWMGISHLEAH